MSFFILITLASCGYTYGIIKQVSTKKENTVPVNFTSYPEGADVIIFGRNMGKTPVTLNLIPNGYYKGVIVKKGYTNKEFTLDRNNGYKVGRRNGWCIADGVGSFLIIPILSASSDYCATLTPDAVFATLDEGNRINVKIHE